MTTFLQILSYGVVNGALYGLAALGLSLLYGVMRYLNVAHGAFIILGAYLSFWLFHLWGVDPFVSIVLVFLLLFVLGLLLFKVLFALLIELPEQEKLKKSLLISFGILLIILNAVILLWTADERGITTFYSGKVLNLGGCRLPYIGLGTVALSVAVIVVLHLMLTRTYFGKAIRAVSQDYEAAGFVGINISRTYLVSFGLGIALASVPGAIIALQGFNADQGWELTNKALIVVVLAGVGSINSLLTAGLLLGLIEAMGVLLLGAAYREPVALALFLLFLAFRPQGLGKRG